MITDSFPPRPLPITPRGFIELPDGTLFRPDVWGVLVTVYAHPDAWWAWSFTPVKSGRSTRRLFQHSHIAYRTKEQAAAAAMCGSLHVVVCMKASLWTPSGVKPYKMSRQARKDLKRLTRVIDATCKKRILIHCDPPRCKQEQHYDDDDWSYEIA